MSAPALSLTRILAVSNGREDDPALGAAFHMARRHGAQVTVLRCLEPPRDIHVLARLAGRTPEALMQARADMERERVEAMPAIGQAGLHAELEVVVGKAFMEIIRRAVALQCDLVIKSAEQLPAPQRFLRASTDQHLLRKCPCPVWLQTEQAPSQPECVLACIDVDEADAAEPDTLRGLNRKVIEAARLIAAPQGPGVVALHAWEAAGEGALWAFGGGVEARSLADAYVKEVRLGRDRAVHALVSAFEDTGPQLSPITPRLARGAPETIIQSQAEDLGADLVVIGTVARTGLGGVIIGNTAENIINSITLPVLAVKPDGFVCPLKF
jgi:nucleotide-binding universal stress UspA family protein